MKLKTALFALVLAAAAVPLVTYSQTEGAADPSKTPAGGGPEGALTTGQVVGGVITAAVIGGAIASGDGDGGVVTQPTATGTF